MPLGIPFGILNGMTLKIDKAGRIVLPKPVRDRFGLRAGSDLELAEEAGALVLKPAVNKPALLRVGGLWVHQGIAPRSFDWSRLLEQHRDERHAEILGR